MMYENFAYEIYADFLSENFYLKNKAHFGWLFLLKSLLLLKIR